MLSFNLTIVAYFVPFKAVHILKKYYAHSGEAFGFDFLLLLYFYLFKVFTNIIYTEDIESFMLLVFLCYLCFY